MVLIWLSLAKLAGLVSKNNMHITFAWFLSPGGSFQVNPLRSTEVTFGCDRSNDGCALNQRGAELKKGQC